MSGIENTYRVCFTATVKENSYSGSLLNKMTKIEKANYYTQLRQYLLIAAQYGKYTDIRIRKVKKQTQNTQKSKLENYDEV